MATRLRLTASAAALAGLLAAGALAQAPPAQPRDPNMPDPKSVPPEKIEPRDPDSTGSTGPSLSDKLERGEGVIKPPENMDPGITRPAPDPGTTPVLPPPGEPGGNPRVQPR